jgi:diaminopimelate epimerase
MMRQRKGAGMAATRFTKAHGLGNDFVIVDGFQQPSLMDTQLGPLAKAMCDRRRGVGADQLLTVEPPSAAAHADGAAIRMRIFNADGGEAEMCGNGIRCVARLAAPHSSKGELLVETKSGLRRCEPLANGSVRVTMGAPSFSAESIGFNPQAVGPIEQRGPLMMFELEGVRGGVVSVGTPHFVAFANAPVSIAFASLRGPAIESHPAFPNRVNAQFATRVAGDRATVRSWERGAGLTEACGTGACAVFAVGRAAGLLDAAATIVLPGGELLIAEGESGEILMTGPATIVYTGEWLA